MISAIKEIYRLITKDTYIIYRSILLLFGLALFSAYIELRYHVNIACFRELLPEWISLILVYILNIMHWILPFALRTFVFLYVMSYVISFIGNLVRIDDINRYLDSLSMQVFKVASRLLITFLFFGGLLYHILNTVFYPWYNVKSITILTTLSSFSWYDWFIYTITLLNFTALNTIVDHTVIYLLDIVGFVIFTIWIGFINPVKIDIEKRKKKVEELKADVKEREKRHDELIRKLEERQLNRVNKG